VTIVLASPPTGIGAAIASLVAHLLAARDLRGADMLGGSAEPNAAAPMPRYVIDLATAAGDDPLASAVPAGWRTIIVGPSPDETPLAVADTRGRSPGGEQRFDSLIRGTLARRLTEAAALAHDLYGHEAEGFEARVLEIPAIYRTALWLHGDRDIFFPVLEGGARDSEPVAEDDDFLARIQHAARQRLAATG
jgi:hypothetical protein